MKSFMVLAVLIAAALAGPVTDSKDASVVRYENNNIGVGEYNYAVETSDGKTAIESGVLKNIGTENEAIEVRGGFTYIGSDGVKYTVSYIANENGFQPTGDHLPTA